MYRHTYIHTYTYTYIYIHIHIHVYILLQLGRGFLRCVKNKGISCTTQELRVFFFKILALCKKFLRLCEQLRSISAILRLYLFYVKGSIKKAGGGFLRCVNN